MGMSGCDQLHEARPRARHADDKDRSLRRVPFALHHREKIGGAGFDQSVDLPPQPGRIMKLTRRREHFMIEAVSLGKARKSLIISVSVVEQHSEGEARIDPRSDWIPQ